MHRPEKASKDMGASCDLAEIPIVYYNFSVRPYFSDNMKLSNLDLKFCPHQGLNQTSLSTKFQNFWTNHLQDMDSPKYPCKTKYPSKSVFM
jgi:hypothetical protein